MRSKGIFGRDRLAILYYAALAGQGAGWIVITSSGRTVADLIESGRRFEQMAL